MYRQNIVSVVSRLRRFEEVEIFRSTRLAEVAPSIRGPATFDFIGAYHDRTHAGPSFLFLYKRRKCGGAGFTCANTMVPGKSGGVRKPLHAKALHSVIALEFPLDNMPELDMAGCLPQPHADSHSHEYALHIHERPANDGHYPFPLVRKRRTLLRGPICAWCVGAAAMQRAERPQLQVRAGGECDWERFQVRCDAWWRSIATEVAPESALLTVAPLMDREHFYHDLACVLIEMLLRLVRGNIIAKKELMAQVRAAKYHKATRFAKALSAAYRDENFPVDAYLADDSTPESSTTTGTNVSYPT